MKKGVSATIIGIILIVVGLAIVLVLLMYFGGLGGEQIEGIMEALSKIRGGAGIV